MDPNRLHDHWSHRWAGQEPLERAPQVAQGKYDRKLGRLSQNRITVYYEVNRRKEFQTINHIESDTIFAEEDQKVLPRLLARKAKVTRVFDQALQAKRIDHLFQ